MWCRSAGVEFLVAPFEADSQLAHLACHVPQSQGGVAAVLTEDSDLVAYGCPRVIFKCDRWVPHLLLETFLFRKIIPDSMFILLGKGHRTVR